MQPDTITAIRALRVGETTVVLPAVPVRLRLPRLRRWGRRLALALAGGAAGLAAFSLGVVAAALILGPPPGVSW